MLPHNAAWHAAARLGMKVDMMGFTQSRWGHLEVLTAIGSRQAMSACGNLRRGCPVPGPGAQQPTANHGERGGGGDCCLLHSVAPSQDHLMNLFFSILKKRSCGGEHFLPRSLVNSHLLFSCRSLWARARLDQVTLARCSAASPRD